MAKAKTNGAAGEGHNSAGLTDDEKSDLIAYYGDKIRKQNHVALQAKADYDAERDELKSLYAKVKGDLLITRKDFEALLAAGDMSEAEFRHAETKRANLFKLAGLPVGQQIDMFAHAADTADEAAEAEANGKRAGLRGDDPSPPSTVSPILHPSWMKGWSEGQAELGARLIRGAELIAKRGLPAADAEPENLNAEAEEEDPGDPDVLRRKAKALKESGFMEPGPAEAEPALETAH